MVLSLSVCTSQIGVYVNGYVDHANNVMMVTMTMTMR